MSVANAIEEEVVQEEEAVEAVVVDDGDLMRVVLAYKRESRDHICSNYRPEVSSLLFPIYFIPLRSD